MNALTVINYLFVFFFTYDFMIGVGLYMDSQFLRFPYDAGGNGEGDRFFHERSLCGAVVNQASVVGNHQGPRVKQIGGLHDF